MYLIWIFNFLKFLFVFSSFTSVMLHFNTMRYPTDAPSFPSTPGLPGSPYDKKINIKSTDLLLSSRSFVAYGRYGNMAVLNSRSDSTS